SGLWRSWAWLLALPMLEISLSPTIWSADYMSGSQPVNANAAGISTVITIGFRLITIELFAITSDFSLSPTHPAPCHLDGRRRIPQSGRLRRSGEIPRMAAVPTPIRGVLPTLCLLPLLVPFLDGDWDGLCFHSIHIYLLSRQNVRVLQFTVTSPPL